jgi:hypothetical protein
MLLLPLGSNAASLLVCIICADALEAELELPHGDCGAIASKGAKKRFAHKSTH